MEFLRKMWSEEEGQGLVEYALVLALIVVIVLAVVPTFQTAVQKVFDNVKTAIEGAGPKAPTTTPPIGG